MNAAATFPNTAPGPWWLRDAECRQAEGYQKLNTTYQTHFVHIGHDQIEGRCEARKYCELENSSLAKREYEKRDNKIMDSVESKSCEGCTQNKSDGKELQTILKNSAAECQSKAVNCKADNTCKKVNFNCDYASDKNKENCDECGKIKDYANENFDRQNNTQNYNPKYYLNNPYFNGKQRTPSHMNTRQNGLQSQTFPQSYSNGCGPQTCSQQIPQMQNMYNNNNNNPWFFNQQMNQQNMYKSTPKMWQNNMCVNNSAAWMNPQSQYYVGNQQNAPPSYNPQIPYAPNSQNYQQYNSQNYKSTKKYKEYKSSSPRNFLDELERDVTKLANKYGLVDQKTYEWYRHLGKGMKFCRDSLEDEDYAPPFYGKRKSRIVLPDCSHDETLWCSCIDQTRRRKYKPPPFKNKRWQI